MRVLFATALTTLALLAWAGSAPAAGERPATPSCEEGPQREGETIVGTACADTIVAPPGVARVVGGGGNDTIVAAPITAASSCPEGCFLGVGSQTFEGGPKKVKMESIFLKPQAITKDNLNVVIDAGWISKAEACQGVKAGTVKACD